MIDSNLKKQIRNKQFAPIYLLFGTEIFLIQEFKQLLISNLLEREEEDFNLALYDLEETAVETALEDAETLPFIGDKRLVFIHNPIFLTAAEKSKEKVTHHLAKLEQYIKEPAPYSVVVFVAPYEKLDERKKITKELKKVATVYEAKKLNEQELIGWIKNKAKSNSVEIENSAIQTLLLLAGTNLFILASEMDKLALYASDSKIITNDMVNTLVARSLEQNIFSLVEKMVQKKIEEALSIYYDLLRQNEEPIKMLALIAGQFRLLYQVKDLGRKGYGQQQMATILKVHPYRIKLAAGQVALFSEQELAMIINLLADADYQLKSSGLDKKMVLEMVLFKIHSFYKQEK